MVDDDDDDDEADKQDIQKLKKLAVESMHKGEENVQQLKCLTNDISQIKNLD
jgi:hypothetical protein